MKIETIDGMRVEVGVMAGAGIVSVKAANGKLKELKNMIISGTIG